MSNKTIIEVAIDDCYHNGCGVKDGFDSIVCEDGYRMTLRPVFDDEINTGVDVIISNQFIRRINYDDKDFFLKIRTIFADTAEMHDSATLTYG